VPVISGNPRGFYRIGRVWSRIAPDGTVHVAWFDNREGTSLITGEWEGQTVEFDKWRVHRAVSFDQGATWKVVSDVSTQPSRGGAGQPKDDNQIYYAPPGEFLSCTASNEWLWIAWPDSRTYLNQDPDKSEIYLRRVEGGAW
jgi:hypothetical protein